MSATTVSPDLKSKLKEYAEGYDKFDDLDSEELDKLGIGLFQRETRTAFLELKSKKDRIKESILREYDIDSNKYE
jgi:hypothetical protein